MYINVGEELKVETSEDNTTIKVESAATHEKGGKWKLIKKMYHKGEVYCHAGGRV